jgi:hypothetical protein
MAVVRVALHDHDFHGHLRALPVIQSVSVVTLEAALILINTRVRYSAVRAPRR